MDTTKKEAQLRILKIATVVILFTLPLIYLYFKSQDLDIPAEIKTDTNQKPDVTALENLVKANPSYENLVNLSVAYINNQMPNQGLNYSKKALEINPQSAIAYNNIGVAYNMMQQYQNGIDACTKALQIDSTFQLAKNNLNWAINEKRKTLETIQKQEQTPAGKKDVAYYIDLGMNYYKLNNFDKSIEVWNKTFEIDPKNTIALNNIGTSFMMKLQYDDAITLFQKALALDPANQLAKNNLAWALDEKNKAETGVKK